MLIWPMLQVYVNSLAEAEEQKTEYMYNGRQEEVFPHRKFQDCVSLHILSRTFANLHHKC